MKARLKTTGVVEHSFTLSKTNEFRGVDWKIYDVGGARNQRQAWAPYFDDGKSSEHCFRRMGCGCLLTADCLYNRPVNAIIFLAPISAFDQVLAEVRLDFIWPLAVDIYSEIDTDLCACAILPGSAD